jgi:dUTP pyrophosphatase
MKIKLIDFGYKNAPERKHYNDTGADVYVIGDHRILSGKTKVIPCGFGINLPDGYNAHFQTRTSIAKRGLFVQQCAIDSGYRGELNMIVTNLSDEAQNVYDGDRLAYLEVYPVVYADFVKELGEERNDGAFGSTNK